MPHNPKLIREAQQAQSCGLDELVQILPSKLEAVIETRAWEGRESASGAPFESFYRFAIAPGWRGLGLDENEQMGVDHLSYQDAIDYCKVQRPKVARMLENERPPRDRHGGDRRSAEFQVDNINLKTKGGTDPTYLAQRMKRDHPEIAAVLASGGYRSVRAAAIAAGIVRVPTPLDGLRRAWAKASDEERAEFLEGI